MSIFKNLPNDFDISQIYVGEGIHITNDHQNKSVNEFVKTGYPQNGTVAYIISLKGAKRLYKLPSKVKMPITFWRVIPSAI